MSVWSKEHNPETSIKRNVFPQSFSNNLTMNFGGIYPFLCQEVMSGDTMEIDSAMGLRFMPTIWPLQNRIRADVHYFYVRNRNLYNEFKEYYTGGTVNKPMPYLSVQNDSFFKTGSLADYLNVPTVLNFSKGDVVKNFKSSSSILVDVDNVGGVYDPPFAFDGKLYTSDNLPVEGTTPYFTPDYNDLWVKISASSLPPDSKEVSRLGGLFSFCLADGFLTAVGSFSSVSGKTFSLGGFDGVPPVLRNASESADVYCLPAMFVCPSRLNNSTSGYLSNIVPCGPWFKIVPGNQANSDDHPFEVPVLNELADRLFVSNSSYFLYFGYCFWSSSEFKFYMTSQQYDYTLVSAASQSFELSDMGFSNPFLGISPQLPLNALPFRAYEQIYNAFFRDERNNPLLIDGKPYYDKYLPSTDGGADAFDYKLHYRNWEQDFLTTALPSPQQGEAPLVGISAAGVMSLSDPETGQVYHAQAITADDADTIVGAKFIETNQDGTSVPNNVARSLVSYATSGISINDFRNVNALQRYLETNLRRGLKYKDLVAARWGVNISYAEMNMPEFIGGFTEYVNPAQVNQTSQDTSSSPLGSYAGQLYCNGQQKHKIRHFCDEEGFIIGVISVVPVPVYSQLLPKMFTKFDRLDYFQPEFGHIGMQPIPMKEVAPLQVAINGGNQDETFGYQRAWYDYLGRVDEVHGQFRGSLRDFLMYRTFSGIPRLSEDFLLVDNKPLDNVFSVQRDADGNSIDKILGQIYVDIVAKRPIPRFGIPRLE
ncbi:major capsid protein [Microvirus mar53]|uniref:Major capsid protein n=1 Tax=Microvirus mar53 TaxID=2851189 RepID=A0A8F6AI87_9VIRU|nr:major capsid protein [Microvirus mar53]